ncbi:unnamed protein product [Diatraea saccharalis]|uniref:Alpha-mannosidase n=1 Tax=Diatraea saccharalis TaxID=40085 RepID=A0A9N9R793_9NEOP|nr:unnamed protein product [Diatraea saccharalis]
MVYTLVRQGRLFFVGGGWGMSDEATTSYHAIIDHFTYTLRKLNSTFLECGRPLVAWQADVLGHSREFASLMAQMGFDGLFINPISFDDELPRMRRKGMEFVWRGNDDLGPPSDIYTHKLYDGYWPPPGFCFASTCNDPLLITSSETFRNVMQRVDEFVRISQVRQAPYYSTKHIMVVMGMRDGYHDASVWFRNIDKLVYALNTRYADVQVRYSTPACYLKAVYDSSPQLQTKQDDFLPMAYDRDSFAVGMFTSRPSIKYLAKEGHRYLQIAKQLQVMARLPNNDKTFEEYSWINGAFQDHNIITGEMRHYVFKYYVNRMTKATNMVLYNVLEKGINKLRNNINDTQTLIICKLNVSRCYPTEGKHMYIVIYNPLAWPVSIPVRLPMFQVEQVVYDPKGKKVKAGQIELPEPVRNIPERRSKADFELVFIAEDVPPMGIRKRALAHIYDHPGLQRQIYQTQGPVATKELTTPNKNNIRHGTFTLGTIENSFSTKLQLLQSYYLQRHQIGWERPRRAPKTSQKSRIKKKERMIRQNSFLNENDLHDYEYFDDVTTETVNQSTNPEINNTRKTDIIVNNTSTTTTTELQTIKTNNVLLHAVLMNDEAFTTEDAVPTNSAIINEEAIPETTTNEVFNTQSSVTWTPRPISCNKSKADTKEGIITSIATEKSHGTIVKTEPSVIWASHMANNEIDTDESDKTTTTTEESVSTENNDKSTVVSEESVLGAQTTEPVYTEKSARMTVTTPKYIEADVTVIMNDKHVLTPKMRASGFQSEDIRQDFMMKAPKLDEDDDLDEFDYWAGYPSYIMNEHSYIRNRKKLSREPKDIMDRFLREVGVDIPEDQPKQGPSQSKRPKIEVSFVSTKQRQVNLDSNKRAISISLANGIKMKLQIQMYYYVSDDPKRMNKYSRPPGAYLMRTMDDKPEILNDGFKGNVYKNQVVQEIHIRYSSWASLSLRLYPHSPVLEVDWLVGPIPIADGLGHSDLYRHRPYLPKLNNKNKTITSHQSKTTRKAPLTEESQKTRMLDFLLCKKSKVCLMENSHWRGVTVLLNLDHCRRGIDSYNKRWASRPDILSVTSELNTKAKQEAITSEVNYLDDLIVLGSDHSDVTSGKEVLIKYSTDLVNDGVFYTDSNGRQTMKRIRNKRPMFDPVNKDPITGNFYPVTSKIYIEDLSKNIRFAVLNDRCQGGSSLQDGEINILLHRRLLTEDDIQEAALNETEYNQGTVIRGQHYLYVSKADHKPYRVFEKKLAKEIELKPQIFTSPAWGYGARGKPVWMSRINEYSGLKTKLPIGVHILTLEQWNDNTLLLRLENYLEKADVIHAGVKKVYLYNLFTFIEVLGVKETTLSGHILLKDWVPLSWNTDKFLKSYNEAYGSGKFEYVDKEPRDLRAVDVNTPIELTPQQIRTFVIEYKYV